MQIKDIFAVKVEERIEPVIKVSDREDEAKLASEICTYVVTSTIEKFLDDFLEHYTDTFRVETDAIGVWISGYFGSGKSHLAKIAALTLENPTLQGTSAAELFKARILPNAERRSSISRSLSRLAQCHTQVMAFNINTITDSKKTPLPKLLLSQFYSLKGYGSNLIYAKVIEAELDKQGKLEALYEAFQRAANKPWDEARNNLSFYSTALYKAACEVAPELFPDTAAVERSLKDAQGGDIYDVRFLIQTLLNDIEQREIDTGKPCRLVLVLDESGQWIHDDGNKLNALQALVETAAEMGKGKIWVFVTTHEDMGAVYDNARALKADMKRIEGRFTAKWNLTTENIEAVLEDRLFRKTTKGREVVLEMYSQNPGVLRDLGQLKNTSQNLPDCTEERFVKIYPYLPYQIHLIPEIVKSLRSSGGRGEQMSGSTRTLVAISQDILRQGRRQYLGASVGALVSFDEIYHNLVSNGEIKPEPRRELSRIEDVVPEATALTRRVAEVLYLIREITYIPRTIDNLARLLVEHTTDDLAMITNRIRPELQKLRRAKLVAEIGEEYEFLTGEQRNFEEEVADEAARLGNWSRLVSGLGELITTEVIGFSVVTHRGTEFQPQIYFDEILITKQRKGYIKIQIVSPLESSRVKVADLEDKSLSSDERETIFVLCDRKPSLEADLRYYLSTKEVIKNWKSDPHKPEDALKLAIRKENQDLPKLFGKVQRIVRESLDQARIVFRGSTRSVTPQAGKTPGQVLANDIATFWPTLYPKFEKVSVHITNEQRAIVDVLKGNTPSEDVKALKLYDTAGQPNPNAPLLDEIQTYLQQGQNRDRVLGQQLLTFFERPGYGWDPNAVRVGVAALVRSGAVRVLINKKPYTNPLDTDLQDALRNSRQFNTVELELEEAIEDPDVIQEVRKLLIKLTGSRKIDETPATLSEAAGQFIQEWLDQVEQARVWIDAVRLPLTEAFQQGVETFKKIISLTNPSHRVLEVDRKASNLPGYTAAIREVVEFVQNSKATYQEIREFRNTLSSVEFRLQTGWPCTLFIAEWNNAHSSATVTEKEVWQDLQIAYNSAKVDLNKILLNWRQEARQTVQTALDDLPTELANWGLPVDEHQNTLSAPLREFLENIDAVESVAHVGSLMDQASGLVGNFRRAISEERRKLDEKLASEAQDGKDYGDTVVQTIRVTEVIKKKRIQSVEDWQNIRDELDTAVQQALAEGKEVELS